MGINRENRWKNCILTNGERPLNSYVSQGGAINRILEVECGNHIYQDPQKTVDILKKNFGFAGKRFVEVIKKIGVEEICDIQREFQERLYNDEIMQKQSIALSILLTADKIATEHIFRDGQYILLNEAKKVLTDRDSVSDNERCYRYLQDKISMNPQRFDLDSSIEKWGILEPDYAILYVQAFKELCKSGGFSDKSFLSWADGKGLLQTAGGRLTKLKKINGINNRCVFLKRDDTKDEEGFEPVEAYEQEELPFS